jgi:hypothetical protein
MALQIWSVAAGKLAAYIQTRKQPFQRALFVIPRLEEQLVIAWMFGNGESISRDQVQQEIDFVRRRLKDTGVEEAGFGLSQDGYTWVLVLKVDNQRYQTGAAKQFQMELMTVTLDEAARRAWQASFELAGEPTIEETQERRYDKG